MEDINNVFIDPDLPDVAFEELGFEEQLKHTQKVKNRILHKLMHVNPNGTLPTDKDSVELMLKVVDSMDKSTIAKKRVQVEEKTGNGAISVLLGIAELVSKSGNSNMFAGGTPGQPNNNRDIGELPDFSTAHAKGEGEQGLITETADIFNTRMDQVNREDMLRREQEMGLTDALPPAVSAS